MDTVGRRIKKIRNMRGLTQKALASKAGMSEITIQSYELEIRRPKPEQLNKIAAALDVDIAFLTPCNTDSRMALMAVVFDFADKYGDLIVEEKNDIIMCGIEFPKGAREKQQLKDMKTAHDKLSAKDFRKWLIDYAQKEET